KHIFFIAVLLLGASAGAGTGAGTSSAADGSLQKHEQTPPANAQTEQTHDEPQARTRKILKPL
ncbi:MAG: hypothetical protein ACTTIC_03015, partial [Helicobacteraceae bacterium]